MRYIKDNDEIKRIESYMEIATIEARKSTCKKSQRGVIIIREERIIGKGYNKVTLEELCNPCIREDIKDNSQVELCSAIHAEQMAILDACNKGESLQDSRMYHIKVKDREMQPSGKPSCSVCSRIIYESGITEFVLWHKDGYAVYTPEEFNRMSFGIY